MDSFIFLNGKPLGKITGGIDIGMSRDFSARSLQSMASRKEPQKVIDLGNREALAIQFIDGDGNSTYWGDPEYVFELRAASPQDQAFLKIVKIRTE